MRQLGRNGVLLAPAGIWLLVMLVLPLVVVFIFSFGERGAAGRCEGLTAMRIMVVDDSETQRRIQRNILEKHNISDVVEAGNGLEAIQRVIEGVPDLILLDWNMPSMDGLTLVGKLRENEALKNVPIIMITSESDKRKVVQALKMGVKGYIVKPFTEETMWEKVQKFVK